MEQATELLAEVVTRRIRHLNGGVIPCTLLDWLHFAGKLHLNVLSIRVGTDFEGALRGHTILIPYWADERRALSILKHEVAELLLKETRHEVARRVERLTEIPDDEAPSETLPEDQDV